MTSKLAMLIAVVACLGMLAWMCSVAGQGSCAWEPVGGGLLGPGDQIRAMAVFDDGTGPALYVGGSFTTIGGTDANYIARWDGFAWTPLGSGVGHIVESLCVFDDGTGPALYAGGWFSTAGGTAAHYIARWDGTQWSALGMGVALPGDAPCVYCLAVYEDVVGPALYAGGWFTYAGGQLASRIARWDGSAWSTLGAGLNSKVLALTTWDDGTGPALYAGGSFAYAGGQAANKVAKWNGNSWSALGTGVSSTMWAQHVLAMQACDDGSGPALYVQGYITHAGSISTPGIARWDGTTWSSLGTTSMIGSSLVAFDDGSGPALYAAVESPGWVARWDGASWIQLGPTFSSFLSGLEVFDDGAGARLHVAGTFSAAGGVTLNRIARWSCPGTISLTSTQPGGGGAPTYFANTNLTPSRQYHNVFSLDLSPGGPGTGPHFGLCLLTVPNYQFILSQLQAPPGTPLFNFLARDSYTIWGGYQIPPISVDGIVFDFTGGVIGAVSPVTRIVVQ
jgi:hypothetical protein